MVIQPMKIDGMASAISGTVTTLDGEQRKLDPEVLVRNYRELGFSERDDETCLLWHRGLSTSDIALGALYLASPASAFVTGSVMDIHGGITSANLDLDLAGI